MRHRLPATPLSITALASWCVGDTWLEGLPIDEAVPMLFRMGPMNEPIRRIVESRDRVAAPCRHAIGESVNEPLRVAPAGRRVYVFDSRPWTRLALKQALDRMSE